MAHIVDGDGLTIFFFGLPRVHSKHVPVISLHLMLLFYLFNSRKIQKDVSFSPPFVIFTMSNGSNVGNSHPIPPPGYPVGNADLQLPLTNLSAIQSRMDYLHLFLSESVHSNTLISKHQMDMVSAEIASAIHQTIVNGAALLSLSQLPSPSPPAPPLSSKSKKGKQTAEPPDLESDCDIVELDAVELLAEHIHFCEVCGKGFKRDANLRMHMRAHGNEFKKPEALAKPADKSDTSNRKTRFSCPYGGCNRNRRHKNFRPLKSVMCVKNHFKRSHCPKMHSCNRCNKKSFSVMADLKSHYKHCGETKWKCSCGTTFSRKDKLFGHVALFEGHVPEVGPDEGKNGMEMMDDDDDHVDEGNQHHRNKKMKGLDCGEEDDGIFEGLLDGFGSIDENYFWKDVLGSSPNANGNNNVDANGF